MQAIITNYERNQIMTAIEDRAKLGASFMDALIPGWEHDVNLAFLDIGSDEFCILGQRYQDYGVGTMRLGISDDMEAQYALGFMATPDGGRAQYPQLTAAWTREIIRRLRTHITQAKDIKKPRKSAARRTQPSLS